MFPASVQLNETLSGGATTATLTEAALKTDIGANTFPAPEPSCAAISSSHFMMALCSRLNDCLYLLNIKGL
jgi:hypothetical protein